MTEERDGILDEVRALVSIEPTPAFELRVRREVQHARPTRGLWWVGALATAIAVVAVGLATRSGPAAHSTTQGATAVVKATPGSPTAASLAPAVELVPVRPSASVAREASRPEARRPEVLVPPDQATQLKKLVAAVRDGRTVLAPAAHDDDPLVVEPLPKIVPLHVGALPGDPADDVNPDIDSEKAEDHDSTHV